jgi:O-antigen/teichoic acid export membrane protein
LKGLRKKALQGLKWTLLKDVSGQFIQFLVLLILARLVHPPNLGLVTMASAFVGFLDPFIDQGFGSAIAQAGAPRAGGP